MLRTKAGDGSLHPGRGPLAVVVAVGALEPHRPSPPSGSRYERARRVTSAIAYSSASPRGSPHWTRFATAAACSRRWALEASHGHGLGVSSALSTLTRRRTPGPVPTFFARARTGCF